MTAPSEPYLSEWANWESHLQWATQQHSVSPSSLGPQLSDPGLLLGSLASHPAKAPAYGIAPGTLPRAFPASPSSAPPPNPGMNTI